MARVAPAAAVVAAPAELVARLPAPPAAAEQPVPVWDVAAASEVAAATGEAAAEGTAEGTEATAAQAETEAAEAQCLVALTVALNRAMVPANRRVKQVPIYPGDLTSRGSTPPNSPLVSPPLVSPHRYYVRAVASAVQL